MATLELLRAVLHIEVVVLLAALLLSAAHTVLVKRREARWRPLLERGRSLLASVFEGQAVAARDREAFEQLTPRLQMMLFAAAAMDYSGEEKDRLTAHARALGLVRYAEAECGSRWWWQRLHGVRVLSLIGGGETVVPDLLADRHHEVRAQAAVWIALHPTSGNMRALLPLLTDRSGLCRFNAQTALLKGRGSSEALIADYLAGGPQEGLPAALRVAVRVAGPILRQPAHDLATHSSSQVRELVAPLLAALGAAEDVAALRALLEDPAANVRAAAVRGLGALAYWAAGPRVAALLKDQAWHVRREAALALRAMGAPGMMLLRRSLASEDPYARDMARQVLDVTGVAS